MSKKEVDLNDSFFVYFNDKLELKMYNPIEEIFPNAYKSLKNTLEDWEKYNKFSLYYSRKEEEYPLNLEDEYEQGYSHGVAWGIMSVLHDLKLTVKGITDDIGDNYTVWEIPKKFVRDLYRKLEEEVLLDGVYLKSSDSLDNSVEDLEFLCDDAYYRYMEALAETLSTEIGEEAWESASRSYEHLSDFYSEKEFNLCFDKESYSYVFVTLMEKMSLFPSKMKLERLF